MSFSICDIIKEREERERRGSERERDRLGSEWVRDRGRLLIKERERGRGVFTCCVRRALDARRALRCDLATQRERERGKSEKGERERKTRRV